MKEPISHTQYRRYLRDPLRFRDSLEIEHIPVNAESDGIDVPLTSENNWSDLFNHLNGFEKKPYRKVGGFVREKMSFMDESDLVNTFKLPPFPGPGNTVRLNWNHLTAAHVGAPPGSEILRDPARLSHSSHAPRVCLTLLLKSMILPTRSTDLLSMEGHVLKQYGQDWQRRTGFSKRCWIPLAAPGCTCGWPTVSQSVCSGLIRPFPFRGRIHQSDQSHAQTLADDCTAIPC